jgi:hypothetical protein
MYSQQYQNPFLSVSTNKTASLHDNGAGSNAIHVHSQNNQINQNQISNYIDVIFRTKNSDIKIRCNAYDNFAKLVEKLYIKVPNLSKLNNDFIAQNKKISYFNTLKENHINNGEIIFVCQKEEKHGQKNDKNANQINNQKIKSNEQIIDETKIMETIALTQLEKLKKVFLNTNNQNQNQINDQMSIYSHQANINQNNFQNQIINQQSVLNPQLASVVPPPINNYFSSGNTRDTEKILVISDLIKNTNYSERNLILKLYDKNYRKFGDLLNKLYNELSDYHIKHLAVGSFMNSILYDSICLSEVLILSNQELNKLRNNHFCNNNIICAPGFGLNNNINMNNNFMRKNSINNNMGYNNMNNNNNNFGIGLGVHQMVRSQTMNNNTMTMNNNILGGQNNPMEQSAMKMGCNFGELGELEKILVEIIGSRTSTELKKIKEIYYTRYNKNLDTDVAFKTSGDFQRILLALLQCKRTYSLNADNEICKKDANDLLKIGVGNWTSYIEVVYNIFATRSPANLRLIYQYFKKQSGKGLLSTVYSEFNGNTKILLETILKANLDPFGFYAKRIHDSILASNYCDLIRNICTRNTKDLFNIRQIYKKNYGSDLLTDIRKLNNTNYNEILYSIVSKSK